MVCGVQTPQGQPVAAAADKVREMLKCTDITSCPLSYEKAPSVSFQQQKDGRLRARGWPLALLLLLLLLLLQQKLLLRPRRDPDEMITVQGK